VTPRSGADAALPLETDRLLLEMWREADWTQLRPIATDPRVMRYITGGRPWSDDEIRDFVRRQTAAYAEHGCCRWKLVYKQSQEMIGFCGIGRWKGGAEQEIGWWLSHDYWGRGLATEAARAALDDAFRQAGFSRIVSIAYRENAASIAIMRKLGLHYEANFESDDVELVRYAIAIEEYVARPGPLTNRPRLRS
jgi:RimJ/RimL family protein N-acetyltransferase